MKIRTGVTACVLLLPLQAQTWTTGPGAGGLGSREYALTNAMTFAAANTYAISIGATLVSIHSNIETNFIVSTFGSQFTDHAWIGLSDASQEGAWIWTDASATDYTNWRLASGEPNGGAGENHALADQNGEWNDYSGDSAFPAIIVRPSGFATSAAQSLYVDGSDASFDVPHNVALAPTGDMTIEAWIYFDAYPVNPAEIANKKRRNPWEGFTLHLQNGAVAFAVFHSTPGPSYSEALASWLSVPQGSWTHVAGVVTGQTIRIVVNGVTQATATCPPGGVAGSTANPLRFGEDCEAPAFNPSSEFNGLIDEVRLWSVGRTDLEIQSTMMSEVDSLPGLVGAWHLNGTGADLTGGFTGSLAGDASFQSCPPSPLSASPSPATPGGPGSPGAVLWSVASGGNGHVYEVVSTPCGVSWTAAHHAALAAGGYLATVPTPAENAFVFGLLNPSHFAGNGSGPWLGAVQPSFASEPGGAWRWVTGFEPFAWTNWAGGEPNNVGDEDRLQYANIASPGTWNDLSDGGPATAYIVEYEPSLTCTPPGGSALTLCASHDAAGAGRMQLFNVPPGALNGLTLMSTFAANPVGGGAFFGMNADLLTLTIILRLPAFGDPFAWFLVEPGAFPESPYFFTTGTLLSLAGQTWDLMAVVATTAGTIHFSNIVQNTW